MNSRRFLLLLGAALLVIAGAYWLSVQRHRPRVTLAGDPVLAQLKPALNGITRLRLSKGDGSEVVLERRAEGWIVTERGYPADSGRVRKLLLDLASLAVLEEKTHEPGNYAVLGVEDPTTATAPGVLVELTGPAPIPALIVGKASGAKAVYVRRRGTAASLLASPQITLDTAPKSWLDHSLLDVKAERVRDVTVTLPATPAYTASRATRADRDFSVGPLPKGRTLTSPDAPDAAGSTLESLSFDDVRAAAASPAGAPAGGYRTVLRTFDGLVVELDGRVDDAHHLLRLLARFDPGARVEAAAGSATATPAAASGSPTASPGVSASASAGGSPAAPLAAGGARVPPALLPVDQVEAEVRALNARAGGFEFELAPYRFEAVFRPLESWLVKPPAPAKPLPAARALPPMPGAARPAPPSSPVP